MIYIQPACSLATAFSACSTVARQSEIPVMGQYLILVFRMLVIDEKVESCKNGKKSYDYSHHYEDPAEALHRGA